MSSPEFQREELTTSQKAMSWINDAREYLLEDTRLDTEAKMRFMGMCEAAEQIAPLFQPLEEAIAKMYDSREASPIDTMSLQIVHMTRTVETINEMIEQQRAQRGSHGR